MHDVRSEATAIARAMREAEHALDRLHRLLNAAQKRLREDGHYDCRVNEDGLIQPLGGTDKPDQD